MNTDDAPLPESFKAPPPVAPVSRRSARGRPQRPKTNRATTDGAPAIVNPGASTIPRAEIKLPTTGELRQQRAGPGAPKALKQAVRDSPACTLNPEKILRRGAQVRRRRRSESQQSQTAQSIGDEHHPQVRPTEPAPIPKSMQVRARLDVDSSRHRRATRPAASSKQLGLSGIVTPGEGGQMRITIGVNPTQFREGKHRHAEESRPCARSSPRRNADNVQEECAGNPDMADDLKRRSRFSPPNASCRVLMETGEYEYVEKDFIFTNQMLKQPPDAEARDGPGRLHARTIPCSACNGTSATMARRLASPRAAPSFSNRSGTRASRTRARAMWSSPSSTPACR